PERGGLARAVGAEQAGHLAVVGPEGHAVDGVHVSETLVDGFDDDHEAPTCPRGSGPAGVRKKGGALTFLRHVPSIASAFPLSRNSSISRTPHGVPITP